MHPEDARSHHLDFSTSDLGRITEQPAVPDRLELPTCRAEVRQSGVSHGDRPLEHYTIAPFVSLSKPEAARTGADSDPALLQLPFPSADAVLAREPPARGHAATIASASRVSSAPR